MGLEFPCKKFPEPVLTKHSLLLCFIEAGFSRPKPAKHLTADGCIAVANHLDATLSQRPSARTSVLVPSWDGGAKQSPASPRIDAAGNAPPSCGKSKLKLL